jgi:hypothetical protein
MTGDAPLPELVLRWLPGRYGVYRLPGGAQAPAWAFRGAFTSVSRSADELSVLCAWTEEAAQWPAIGPLVCCAIDARLDFSLTGIIARLSAPLAREGISLFSVATYDTDYLLVGEAERDRCQAALESEGVRFRLS